ncbi:MAG: M56 family metallopeptidase [Acidobacteriota bacterium]|nr:M56 family metallopeptidase [Acidobacteriota bacterium]
MVFDIGIRASIVVLAALAVTAALRHRSATLRHWVLAAGIFSAAAVAPLSRALPAWDFPQLPATAIDSPAAATHSSVAAIRESGAISQNSLPKPGSSVPFDFGLIAGRVWAAGFAISALMMLVSGRRLIRVTSQATPMTEPRWLELNEELSARLGVRHAVAILATDLRGMVGTWGWRRPCVLLPEHYESWTDARIRIVLGHELAHIRRNDWGIQVAAEIVRAVFWFSPFFWIACGRLRRESEQACDDAVLEAGVPAAEYASHLLDIARTCRPAAVGVAVLSIARPSTLEWRITAMLNTTLARKRPTRRAVALVVAVILGVALSAASFRAKEQTGPLPLTGVVYDMTGAVLPEVALTLEDATGASRTDTTDRDGRFDLGVTAPGRYMLSSKLIGFATITQAVTLQEARQWEQAITLQVGTIQETITVTDQRPSAVAASQRAPVRIGGNIRPPRKTEDVRPIYPQAMRDAGMEGFVPLGALIDVEGRVSSVRLIGAHAHPELAKAAIDAVRQWRFTPTLLNGDAVEVFMNVTVRFSLQD